MMLIKSLLKAQFELTHTQKNVLALVEQGVFWNGWTERQHTHLFGLALPYKQALRV